MNSSKTQPLRLLVEYFRFLDIFIYQDLFQMFPETVEMSGFIKITMMIFAYLGTAFTKIVNDLKV